jgi:acetyl esterase/lipase
MTHPIQHGIAVACIQYTLALEKPFPQQLYDIKTAIRYFHANADQYRSILRRFSFGENRPVLIW